MVRPLLIALQFLTRFPIPKVNDVDNRNTGRSLLYYPVVGLLIGLLLAAVYWVLDGASDRLAAALLLFIWVLITGGLHLDGLADSADAWVGGLGDRERTLTIMKDPYCGPAAVVALVIVLIIKLTALEAVVAAGNWMALVMTPVLARTALPVLFLTTPYLRADGLGSALAEHLPRVAVAPVVVTTAVAMLLISGTQGLWLVITAIAVFAVLRGLMMSRIGGTTGDTAGAAVELTETALLIVAAVM